MLHHFFLKKLKRVFIISFDDLPDDLNVRRIFFCWYFTHTGGGTIAQMVLKANLVFLGINFFGRQVVGTGA